MKKIGWEKWDWDSEDYRPKKKILSIARNTFYVLVASWAVIGGLLGYALAEIQSEQHALNMVC